MSILNKYWRIYYNRQFFWNIVLHKCVFNSKDKKLSSRHTNTLTKNKREQNSCRVYCKATIFYLLLIQVYKFIVLLMLYIIISSWLIFAFSFFILSCSNSSIATKCFWIFLWTKTAKQNFFDSLSENFLINKLSQF